MDTTAILELLNEQSSLRIFPEVKTHLQGKIQKFIFDPAQKIDFMQKVEVSGSHIHVPRNMDILYGMEITGSLQIGDVLYDKPEDIIKSIDLVIGGQNIATFYLQNKMCDISVHNNCFSITIKFDKLFYNQEFLTIVGLVYHDIKMVIYGLHQDYHCFLHCAIVQEYRQEIATMKHNILMKECIKYNGEITRNKLFINNGDGMDLMSRTNFINSLYFKFDKNIRDILRSITIKTGDEKTITILSNNDLQFLNSNEFIMEKFHYKTFLYNRIILEFEMIENFDKTSFELITTNNNSLMIQNGMGGKRFAGFRREITCSFQDDEFIKISNELYEEKVVPKNDLICGISQEEFEENEERIISGCCFSSYKRNAVVDWFNIKRKKVCPSCRNENGVWYFMKNI
jgi:hypothetical protein